MTESDKISVFQGKKIRSVFYKDVRWFSIIDIVEALTGSSIPKRYWSDLKKRLISEGYNEVYDKIVRLKLLEYWKESHIDTIIKMI